jgi:hypothetical protein
MRNDGFYFSRAFATTGFILVVLSQRRAQRSFKFLSRAFATTGFILVVLAQRRAQRSFKFLSRACATTGATKF